MTSILVSIVCLVFLSIVVDILLPKGNTNKFIKSIFGFIMVLTLIVPILDFTDDIFEDKDDISVVYLINQSKVDNLCSSIDIVLYQNGIDGVYVEIDMNMYEYDSTIDGVSVYLDKLVLLDDKEHIHISDEILKCILSIVDVDESKVVFYG